MAFDLRLAGYLLSPNSTEYTPQRLAGEYGVPAPVVGPEGTEVPDTALRAAWLLPVCRRLEQEIAANGQEKLLREVEIPLAQVLASMERVGFLIDREKLAAFGE